MLFVAIGIGVVLSILFVTKDVSISSRGSVTPGGSFEVDVNALCQLVSFLPISQPSCFKPLIKPYFCQLEKFVGT